MGQEAKVVFSETGSESVVNSFKNVGAEAGKASTNIGTAGNAIKDVGSGMKNAASNIGSAVSAFATLTLSVVSTWRAYRDLGDAQLAVDKANFKVQKSTQAVTAAQKLVDKLKASAGKTDLKAIANASALKLREDNLKKAVKDGSKTRLEAKKEQDSINLARSKEGTDKAALLAKAEQDLKNKTEQLGLVTESAAQKQKHLNDSQQDFYLSLLPTALSTVGTVVSGFESLKNVIGGGGTGLIGSLSGIGLILGGASIALLAYQQNWLGFKDAVGGAIDWVKERFGLWKDTIAAVFNLIKSGDWNGAFALIKTAAIKFWEDLKKSVPFFGGVAILIDQLMHGNWIGAFNTIKVAAAKFWADMKIALPFLADIESIVEDIKNAKWSEAFTKIKDAATTVFNETLGKGFAFIFGDNWKLGLDAWLKLQESEAAIKKRPLILQYATTINATITALTGIDFMKWFKEHPIAASIPFGLGFFVPVDDPKFRGSVATTTMAVIKAIGEGLNRIAGLMDPYIAGLFVEKNWTDAIESSKQALINAGKDIWKHIFDGIGQGLTDQNWLELLGKIPMNIQEWTKKNAPETFKTSRQAAKGGPLQAAREKGVELNPIIPDNFWTRAAHDLQVKLGIIHPELEPKLVLNPNEGRILGNAIKVIKPPPIQSTAELDPRSQLRMAAQLSKQKVELGQLPAIEIPTDANMAPLDKTLNTAKTNIPKMPASKMPIDGNVNPLNKTMQVQVNSIQKTTGKMKLDANSSPAQQKLNAMKNAINSTHATIKVGIAPYSPAARVMGQSSYDAMVRKALGAQGGMHQTLSRDTLIQAHKGEQVDIDHPAKQSRKSGNSSAHITISFEPEEFKQFIRYSINENQGVIK